MTITERLKRLLLVHDHEWALVSRMFAFEFFQGGSIALFFTSAMALFLDHHDVSELPVVFILSAFLLWFFGMLYARLEHALTVKQITLAALLFNTFSILVFRFFVFTDVPGWFYYLMLAWFNVTYLLNNLEFWGLASRLFDVRQSKRLFSIVSAGDIPAKFIGFVAAIVIVPIIGTRDLLWIAAASSLVSLLFFHRLVSVGAFKSEVHHSHTPQHNPRAKDFYDLIVGSKLIQEVAFISFFTLCCFTIVNFVFYGYVKEQFHHDQSLATFIALFLAASRAITLVIKLLFTNRIADRLGIMRSLLITPVALALLCILSFTPSIFGSEHAEFYLFAMMAIVTDVLRSAIQSPVLLSTMQPLSVHQRLQGHTIMKGVMDPFAFFVVGILLMGLYRFDSHFDLRILSAVIMVMVALWIAWIFSADKNYLQTLTAAIRNRSLNSREIVITDKESLDVLRKKISGDNEGEAVFVLHMLREQPVINKVELIVKALAHAGVNVRREAVKLISHIPHEEAVAHLHHLLNEETDPYVKAEAIRMLSGIKITVDILPFLDHADPVISSAAIASVMIRGNEADQNIAAEKLKNLSSSQNSIDRKCAAQTIGEVHNESLLPMLISLLHDSDPEVSNAAMIAACKLKSASMPDMLLKPFTGKNKANVLQVLEACGAHAIPAISNFIRTNQQSEIVDKMITIMGKIGGDQAQYELAELIEALPQHEDVILNALHQSGFHAHGHHRHKYENLARIYLKAAVQIAFRIHFLQKEKVDTLVADALNLELNLLRDCMMDTFTLLYDSHKIQRAKAGLKMNTRESVPNAIELIDQLVAKEFSQAFICLYEQAPMERKYGQLKQLFGEPYLSLQMIRTDILSDKSHNYFPWTKACVIYSVTKAKGMMDAGLLKPLQHSANELLRETANFALKENTEMNALV